MATKNDIYPPKYFRASGLDEGWTKIVTVEMCRREDFPGQNGGRSVEKLVAYFVKERSGLVIGPTVWDDIAGFCGEDDFEKWKGDAWELFLTTTFFGGKRVPCIRVRKPTEEPKAKAKSKSPKPKPDYDDPMPEFKS